MECDTSKWKEFALIDLFGNCIRGIRITTDDRIEGNIPFVTAGEFCEGISELIGNPEATMFSNALTIDMFGNCFYHGYDFKCDDNILVITNNNINAYTGLFVANVIAKDKYRNNYGRQYRQKDYIKHKIKLPADSNGKPDWFFMENYIKSLHYKPLTTENKPGQAPDLNVKDWKEFEIEALFPVIIKGKCNDASCLSAGNDINYIGAKYSDNGVMKSCSLHENINYISEGNCVAMIGQGQGSAGYAIYLDSDFIGSTALNLGYADWVNPYTAHFVTTVLCKEYEKYSFGRSWTGYRLKKTKIKLPADTNGEPDWFFMENYIKSLHYKPLTTKNKPGQAPDLNVKN